MKNEFHRILSVFLGALIILIAIELIWIIADNDKLTILRLIFLLITVAIGATLVKVGLQSS